MLQKKKKWGYFQQKIASNLTKNDRFLGLTFPTYPNIWPLIPIYAHLLIGMKIIEKKVSTL